MHSTIFWETLLTPIFPTVTVVKLLIHVWLFGNPMDCSPPGPSVHGISQARILKWVAISFSRGSSQPRAQTHVSCIGRQILHHWVTREALIQNYWIKSNCIFSVLPYPLLFLSCYWMKVWSSATENHIWWCFQISFQGCLQYTMLHFPVHASFRHSDSL